jgi:hypothetical protein
MLLEPIRQIPQRIGDRISEPGNPFDPIGTYLCCHLVSVAVDGYAPHIGIFTLEGRDLAKSVR